MNLQRLTDWEHRQRLMGGTVAGLGVLALLVPLWPELAPGARTGALLLLTAAIEAFHGFRRAEQADRRAAWFGSAVTFAMGLLLLVAPALAGRTLVLLVGGWFAVDGVRYVIMAVRDQRAGESPAWNAAAAVGNFAVLLTLAGLGGRGVLWTIAVAAALRIFGTAGNILRTRSLSEADAGDTAVRDLGLNELPEARELGQRLAAQENARRPIDWFWIGVFGLTLFSIHLGRMGLDRTALGIVSPAFAVVGDLVVALGLGLGVIVPAGLLWRMWFRPLERRAWRWCLSAPVPGGVRTHGQRLLRAWLTRRLRLVIRLRQASYSVRALLGLGLRAGLPAAAVLAATMPVWGVSWYFDTENYAAGIWNSWAEARTDTWREAMIHALTSRETGAGRSAPTFALHPPGVANGTDFAFLIIGDTGEGDASQHVLRDQLILAAAQTEVQFVIVSSDVVYPIGAMRDYEAKFFLPFKGVTKPVYAIPGNHDWYDALEAFAATFLEPEAARTVMRARVNTDHHLTSTTDARIEELLAEAGRLRREYGVPTGFQLGPFFQFQTDRFALFALDTGVRKRLDPAQLAWLKPALESARGKLKLALLGHPLFACGRYRAAENEEFAALHRLLREHDVRIVMAGDTHDLEYYVERPLSPPAPPQHHFVNGGGGAFLTLGAQLTDPAAMPTPEWAFYPARAPILAKIEARNPFWKRPLWWWTREFQAWPFAPEWLSAAFDYNVSPFFQSFIEVRVEPSAGRVRLLPWGVRGRLRWSDLQTSPALRPAATDPDAAVVWTFDLPAPERPPAN
jgi:uncharacterized membrane protein HdeD (DUF308 family)